MLGDGSGHLFGDKRFGRGDFPLRVILLSCVDDSSN